MLLTQVCWGAGGWGWKGEKMVHILESKGSSRGRDLN